MTYSKKAAIMLAIMLVSGGLFAQIVPQDRRDTIVLSAYNANQRFMLYQAPVGTPIPAQKPASPAGVIVSATTEACCSSICATITA